MMLNMRTTVNIEEELLARAKVLAVRANRPMGSVLEEALRKYLQEYESRVPEQSPELPVFTADTPGLRPGVDLDDKEQVADLLGDNARVGL